MNSRDFFSTFFNPAIDLLFLLENDCKIGGVGLRYKIGKDEVHQGYQPHLELPVSKHTLVK